MKRAATLRPIVLAAAIALLPASVLAQRGQDGGFVGAVHDQSGAVVVNATVTVSSPQLIGGSQTATTDESGEYRFPALAPGVYRIVASRPGLETAARDGVTLPAGFTLTVDFTLAVSGLAETVLIAADVPVVDVRTSSSSMIIDRALIENLPLSRSVADLVNLAPGVVRDVAFGGSQRSNPLSIDGTSGNEPGWGTPTVTPNPNWIDEVQIVSVGADAQYGEFTGVRENAITRSGANAFSGLFDALVTRPSWTGNNRGSLSGALQERFRPVEIVQRWDTDFQVGGPVSKDRVWFFAGGEMYRNAYRPASFSAVPKSAGEPKFDAREPKFIGKLTASSGEVRFEGYYIRNAQTITGLNAGPLVQPEALANYDRTEHIWNGRVLWMANPRTVVEFRHGGHSASSYQGPPEERRAGPPGHSDLATGVASENPLMYNDLLSRPIATGVHATYMPATRRSGAHEFRGGFEFEHARLYQANGFVGGLAYYDRNGLPDTRYSGGDTIYRPTFTRTSVYVQDGWSVGDRVTINAGARGGRYSGHVPVRGDVFSARSLSPRLGGAFDVEGDHRTVIRAHYGRYHDPMATTFFDFLDPLSQGTTVVSQAVGSEFVEVTRFGSTVNGAIDPDLKFSFADEWVVEGERQAPGGIAMTLRFVRRDFKDSIGFIDLGSTWQPTERIDPGPDGRIGTADDKGAFTVFYDVDPSLARLLQTNPAGAYRRYRAVQLIAARRSVRSAAFQASYTWSRTTGNYNNAFSSNAGSNDLGTNGVFVNPNRALNAEGRTPQDFTHELKVVATARLAPWGGLNVSGVYRFQSGRTWARTASFGPLTQLVAINVEPRATRALDAVNTIDVRVEKTLSPWPGATRLGLFADVFNALNQGIALGVNPTSGPNFALPTQWAEPRTLRAGARVVF